MPVTVRSAGTSLSDGAIAVKEHGIVLLMERMHKILEINEASMYMVVEAGALTKEIQEAADTRIYCTPEIPATLTVA